MIKKIYKRDCPNCGKSLKTYNKYYFKKAVKDNKLCASCSLKGRKFSDEHKKNLSINHADVSGENNPFYNKKHSELTKDRISRVVSEKYKNFELRKKVSEIQKEWHKNNENSFKNKSHSNETKKILSSKTKTRMQDYKEREKISKSLIDNTPWNKGRNGIYNPETLHKMRSSAIKRIELYGNNQIHSYNLDSIPIIEKFGRDNGYHFQHAENGGEYHVPNTRFMVDGYDAENNVVIEFDEKYHFREVQREKDKQRQEQIGIQLRCKFIRINEELEVTEFDYSSQTNEKIENK